VKKEALSPAAPFKQRRVRVIRRLVERPKTVYERFPSFEKNRVLDFTELFQGFAVKKSRVVKRPLQCAFLYTLSCLTDVDVDSQWNLSTRRRRTFLKTSSMSLLEMRDGRWQTSALKRWYPQATSTPSFALLWRYAFFDTIIRILTLSLHT
jgi:hypothetical protein